jgi:hypothetical protein
MEERIGLTDSLMFPVIASCMLLALFLVFKYLDSKWINKILGGYCEPNSVVMCCLMISLTRVPFF